LSSKALESLFFATAALGTFAAALTFLLRAPDFFFGAASLIFGSFGGEEDEAGET